MKDKTEKNKAGGRFLPWWLHLILAILSYCLLKYGVDQFDTSGSQSTPLSLMAEQAAPIVAIGFLLLAANALYKKDPPKSGEKRDDDLLENQ